MRLVRSLTYGFSILAERCLFGATEGIWQAPSGRATAKMVRACLGQGQEMPRESVSDNSMAMAIAAALRARGTIRRALAPALRFDRPVRSPQAPGINAGPGRP